MAKRMYAIARELNTDCRSLIRMAKKFGMDFRSHMSIVSDAEEMNIKQAYKVATRPPAPPPETSRIAPKLETKPPVKSSPTPPGSRKTNAPVGTATPTSAKAQRPADVVASENEDAVIISSSVIAKPAPPVGPAAMSVGVVESEEEDDSRSKGGKGKNKRKKGRHDQFQGSDDDRGGFDRGGRKHGQGRMGRQRIEIMTQSRPVRPITPQERKVVVQMPVTVKGLCATFGEKADSLIKKLFEQGKMKRINDFLSREEVEELAIALDIDATVKEEQDAEESVGETIAGIRRKDDDTEASLKVRPPVVTILGHVDHGKTSLLDRIRETDVASGEAGGITQHIGAFHVALPDGRSLTFLDTPGHEAFTAMRARGASITDIAVLVVAADDGVMPTTVEAINHARAAEVPIIVALNKIDRPEADPNRVKGQLAEAGLTPTGDWGGDTEVVETSANPKKPSGIEDLLDTILLQAEILELRANPSKQAIGSVVEAKKDPKEGVSVTVLVQEGTLRVGDIAIAGEGHGKVRFMYDDKGHQVEEASPSIPVKVFGFTDVPEPGDKFWVTNDLAQTRQIAEDRANRRKTRILANAQQSDRSAETLLVNIKESKISEVCVIVKTDTQGSAEVLNAQLSKLGTTEVRVKVVHCAVGPISESDVNLAIASNKEKPTLVIGFHVIADQRAQGLADAEGIQIRTFRVIYELIDFVKQVMEGQLEPEEVEVTLGRAEVRKVFPSKKVGTIAGCMVTQGLVHRNSRVRLYRDGKLASPANGYEVGSIRRHTDDVREVKEGFECGIVIANFNDVKEADVLEFFRIEEKERKLV